MSNAVFAYFENIIRRQPINLLPVNNYIKIVCSVEIVCVTALGWIYLCSFLFLVHI